MPWTEDNIPSQEGRTVFVSGATDGLGLRAATVLAGKGAEVLIGYRNREHGKQAFETVSARASGPMPQLIPLELGSQSSVAAAATEARRRCGDRLDVLINNGGVMAPPLSFSPDGIESQWAINVIGHAALTWQLLPALVGTPSSRVVGVSSIAHWFGTFTRDRLLADWRGEDYGRFGYYCRTKLGDLVFARELQRRLAATGVHTISVAAHPGLAATTIAGSTTTDAPAPVRAAVVGLYQAVSQPVDRACLPILFAATRPGLRGAELIGPSLLAQTRGYPRVVRSTRASRDRRIGSFLWRQLEVVTAINPELAAP